MSEAKIWPGETDEAHPEIFNTIPPQPKVLKPGQLTEEKVKQFFDQGFLVVEKFFQPEELIPAIEAVNSLVEELAQKLYKGGKIKSLHSECGFYERLAKLEKEFPGANILLHKLGKLPQAFRDIWGSERLLNVAEQLLGTVDLAGHPVWNLRCKTPQTEAATVPWHQDAAYLDNDAYKVFQLTAWIPLLDANATNGCMQNRDQRPNAMFDKGPICCLGFNVLTLLVKSAVVRSGHKTGKIAKHIGCWRDTWYISLVEEDAEKKLGCTFKEDTVTCPIPFGGLLLLNNVIPHRSLDNMSDKIRWSLDLRWQDANKSVGFFGLKDGVKMRSSSDSNFKTDWETFDAVSRHEKQFESMNTVEEEFDTTIPGPWMKKWELVHHNRHTRALEKQDGSSWHNLIVG